MTPQLVSMFHTFSIWFRALMRELVNNLISVIFVIVIYATLWFFPQALDLLLILNQGDAFFLEVPLYFGLLTAAAFLIWNSPKYLYYHNYSRITFFNLIGLIPNHHYRFQREKASMNYSYEVKVHMRMMVPRILAILLLVISSLSMLNAMESFGLVNTYTEIFNPSNTLLVCIILLLIVSEPNVYHFLKSFAFKNINARIIVVILSVILLGVIISLGTLNTKAEKDLGNLFISSTSLTLLFTLLSFNSFFVLKKLPQQFFYGAILLSGFILLGVFLVLNIVPELASGINPLSILVLSFISLFMLSFLLMLLGKKIRLPLFTLVFVGSIILSKLFAAGSDHYHLDLVDTEMKRPTMDAYVYDWIQQRKEKIACSETPFPVLLVAAEGGGSRAGLWSFLVHSYLYKESEGRYFTDHLLSLTGASGGSVGNAMFFSEAQSANQLGYTATFEMKENKEYPSLSYKASAIYKENYLSIALLSLLGRDLLKETTDLFSFDNRGQLLENQWSTAHKAYFSDATGAGLLDKEFLSFYKKSLSATPTSRTKAMPPLLLINTTHTQSGGYHVISPVTYEHLRPLTGLVDFFSTLAQSHPQKSIRLSTAMRINASFPYVTPVGEIPTYRKHHRVDQYADAGYYDNVGGRVSRGVEEVFRQVVRDSFPELLPKINIKNVLIVHENEPTTIKKETQFTAPLITLMNVRSGHTNEVAKKLESGHVIELQETEIVPNLTPINIMHTGKDIKITPILPLGRYLSTIAIRSMEARLEEINKDLDKILE